MMNRLSVAAALILATAGCRSGLAPVLLPPHQRLDLEIRALAHEEQPYHREVTAIVLPVDLDAGGVQFLTVEGRRHYHPAEMCQHLLELIEAARHRGSPWYRERAELYAEKLLSLAVEIGGGLWFPYTFEFALHGNPAEVMKPPWFSGYSQGYALSALVRMFQLTGEKRWADAADKIFRSFELLRGAGEHPWVTRIDAEGWVWLEEYPFEEGTGVLNGFNTAVFGLYDYWLLRRSEQSLELLRSALSTIRSHMEWYRKPGDVSYYCRRHRHQAGIYHRVVDDQLEMHSKITGDPAFKLLADQLRQDLP